MAGRKKSSLPMPEFHEVIVQKSMEQVMHDSIIPYSEFIIMERAIPRVEDGLKPVQRRVLYTMHELGLTPDKPHRKCARIVGDCLGKYHPHGDSSVYDALARMAQPFSLRGPLVDGHGNFGSIDGDSPAAMRYTEARMTPLALQMLRDIEKDTVGFHLNFDDTQKEPDLLPCRFPNLLVNGASGIAIGLATNIPPHNLREVIAGTIAQMENPDITLDELMGYIPAPDFPTGGILLCDEELKNAYATGRGKLQLRSRVSIEEGSAGRKLLVITEIPYMLSKSAMLEKILKLSEEKKNSVLSGIYDIRDESDRTGMRAVIELKKDSDPEKVLAYLYKYSDLQVTFGANLVAIADGKPMQLGLKQALSYYIQHQKNVVTRRTQYDLDQAKARAHILEGLIVAVDNLDEVIRLIRASKNPKEAKSALMQAFSLTDVQAQAILDMRLQRLTNLEILTLRKEYAEVLKLIDQLTGILKSEKKLLAVIKKELLEISEQFGDDRRTELTREMTAEAPVEEEKPVADEALIVLTRGGFLKRMPPRVYEKGASGADQPADPPLRVIPQAQTDWKLLFFTDQGSCCQVTASQVPECRYRDRGLALAGLLAGLEKDERVIEILPLAPGDWAGELLFATAKGQIKKSELAEYSVRKQRFAAIGLKNGDRLLSVTRLSGGESLLMVTKLGMAIHFSLHDVACIGRTAAGVKGMTLGPGDEVLRALVAGCEGELLLLTDKGYMKRCLMVDFEEQARGGKGLKCITLLKTGVNGESLVACELVKEPFRFTVVQKSGLATPLDTDSVHIEMRSGKGTPYVLVTPADPIVRLER